jgi:transcriptional regulator with XRE-family HTH domain
MMTRKEVNEYIGSRIKMFRENRGFTQGQLGKMLNPKRSTSMISSIELAERNPDAYVVYQIAVNLKIAMEELLPRSLR